MSNVQRFNGRGSSAPLDFSRPQARALTARNNREIAEGIVSNTRLSVANFLTATAMNHTANLVNQARSLAAGDQYLASRLAALVDGYVSYARGEITSYRQLPW